jgi:hypothetical protein
LNSRPRSLYLTWPILPHYNGTIEELATSAAEIFAAIKSGVLKVDPTNVYRFDQLVDAHRCNYGKAVFTDRGRLVPGRPEPLQGPAGYLTIIGIMRAGFPDIQCKS